MRDASDPVQSASPSATPVVAGAEARSTLRGSLGRALGKPSPAEWVLAAYLLVVIVLTIVGHSLGRPFVLAMASTPDDVAAARVWPLVTSALLVDGPLVPQIVATAVLGVLAIRLAGGRLFWSAALVAHLAGTLLVYAGLWIADGVGQPGPGLLMREADFGSSLIWCAALGVLAGVAWWKTRPLSRQASALLAIGPPVLLAGVTLVSPGLALYEHVAAFGLAVFVVFAARHWAAVGDRLGLTRLSGDLRS